MSNYKEIVTKAVLGKGKKKFVTNHSITPNFKPTNILGCWVINHNFRGYKNNGKISIEGTYDVNIWYSCDDDSKTEVIKETNSYLETVVVNANSSSELGTEEIIVRSLEQPTCLNATVNGDSIDYTIEKELGIEIIGDTKVKIAYDENEEPWEDLNNISDSIDEVIDNEVNEDYI